VDVKKKEKKEKETKKRKKEEGEEVVGEGEEKGGEVEGEEEKENAAVPQKPGKVENAKLAIGMLTEHSEEAKEKCGSDDPARVSAMIFAVL
jgi:hypothetical protein